MVGYDMTLAQLDDIFAQTLLGDYGDDAPWQAVRTLHRMGSREVFEYAAEWCHAEHPLKRARGADVLAQLGKTTEHPSNNFPDESFSLVSALVREEEDPLPLSSAIYALGHIENPLAAPLVIAHRLHPKPAVRFAVAFALGKFADVSIAIEALLALTQDADEDVHDWATFGVGVLGDGDSPEIRDALVKRLSDSDEDVREEAMVGLGKRKDQRVLAALLFALEQPTATNRAVEAASEMLDMQEERESWKGADYAAALRERFSS
jgi:HEAT repeat protein